MDQAELLAYCLDLLERIGIPHMLVGSFASGAWGEPRLTQDIDVVIDPTPDQLAELCAAFGPDEFNVSADAAADVLRRRSQFNVIHPSSGNKVDFMIAPQSPWGREQIQRRQHAQLLPDRFGFVARPEDVILSKMLYYREGGSEKHLRDITGILKVSGDEVDRAYVWRWAGDLGVNDIWRAILVRLGQS